MSISFFIKNKKKLLSYAPVLTVGESLSLIPDLEQFSFKSFETEEDEQNFFNSKISNYVCLLYGIYGESGLGFELSYEETSKTYAIRLLTPSTRNDWVLAIKYMSILAKKFDSDIRNEHGEAFTNESIKDFPYENDIRFGIKALFENKDDEANNSISFGIIRPVSFNDEMINRMLKSEDPISAYEDILNTVQYTDAYSARQFFYENKENNQIFGQYNLTQNLRTILPYKPYVEFENWDIVKTEDVACWKISFCAIFNEGEENEKFEILGDLPYETFIERLPKDKYKFIDADYIVVEELSYKELLEILGIPML